MTILPAQKAIANLIDSAERGEIDPWDVPVIEIIDRFLTELGLTGTVVSPTQEANLPQSGQAFLWASMLVLLKADTLEILQAVEEVEEEEGEIGWDEIEPHNSLPSALEDQIRRRSTLQPLGKRKVTLPELIEQLEYIAAEIESVSSNSRPKKKSVSSRRAAMKAIAKLAHNENLTELALQLEHFLYLDFPQIAANRNEEFLDWEHLLQWWQKSQNQDSVTSNQDSRTDRAAIFWALLLLSSQSKVELSQEEFYQDLSLRPLKLIARF